MRVSQACEYQAKRFFTQQASDHSAWDTLHAVYRRMIYANALAMVHPSRFYFTVPMCSTCYKLYTYLDAQRDTVVLHDPVHNDIVKDYRAEVKAINSGKFADIDLDTVHYDVGLDVLAVALARKHAQIDDERDFAQLQKDNPADGLSQSSPRTDAVAETHTMTMTVEQMDGNQSVGKDGFSSLRHGVRFSSSKIGKEAERMGVVFEGDDETSLHDRHSPRLTATSTGAVAATPPLTEDAANTHFTSGYQFLNEGVALSQRAGNLEIARNMRKLQGGMVAGMDDRSVMGMGLNPHRPTSPPSPPVPRLMPQPRKDVVNLSQQVRTRRLRPTSSEPMIGAHDQPTNRATRPHSATSASVKAPSTKRPALRTSSGC